MVHSRPCSEVGVQGGKEPPLPAWGLSAANARPVQKQNPES